MIAASSGSNGSPTTAAPSISARGSAASAATSKPIAGQQRRRQRAVAAVGDPRELVQVQRDAARLAHDTLAHRRVRHARDELERRLAVERVERELLPPGRAARRVEQAAGRADRARGDHQQRRNRDGPAQQVQNELERGLVGPVQVVQQHGNRPEPDQPRRDRAVAQEALGDRHLAGRARVLAERVDDQPVGHVALVLGPAPGDDLQSRRACALADLRQQGTLAQSCSAQQPEHPARATAYVSDRASGAGQLRHRAPATPCLVQTYASGAAIPGG